MTGLPAFNAMPEAAAAARLRDCCGSTAWIRRMLARRPFRSLEHLLIEAEAAWRATGPADWDEAFAHHPRIGEREPEEAVSRVATAWAAGEQRQAHSAEAGIREALTRANAEYERRFGRIYVVCATGLRADDILRDLTQRLGNEPGAERARAAAEQAKITALRLRKLIGEER